MVEYLQKRSPVFSNYLQNIYKKCSLDHSVFIVAPPPSISASAEGTDSTERSPASKNPNGASGTCLAGDRPVLQTRSSSKATDSRPDDTLSCP